MSDRGAQVVVLAVGHMEHLIRYGDNRRLRSETHWTPRITLETSLREMVEDRRNGA